MSAPESTSTTFVFTDIEGSTRLFHELGDAWLAVLDEHYGILRSSFAVHGGREVKSEGDALFVVFDDPIAAVTACVEAQQGLIRHEWSSGREIRVRMGMHTGTAFKVDDDFVGLAVHEAARVGAAGHGGQVLVSEATARAVKGRLPEGITLADLGRHALKDFAPQHLFQASHADLPMTFPPPRTLTATEHNLPSATTSIVGRVAEMESVERLLLRDARLVTVTGMGGIGKSRVALEVGRSLLVWFRGGVWFVEFAAVDDPSTFVSVIAAVLGVTEQPGRPILDAVAERIAGSATLLVLDNLEHLLDGVVAIADLLAACPDLKVLATSRERLRLRGEHLVEVPPLDTSDAETLFVHRARAVSAGFGESDADYEAAAQVAERLDGVPLAIELAAARLPDLGLAAVLDGLSSALDLLSEGERDLPPRHQAMRATLLWSYQLLDAREQAVFAALGAFAGGASLEALAAVSDVDPEAIVPSLAAKGLVRRRDVDGSMRVEILEVVRQFAAERLAESGRMERAHAAHLEWMTEFAVRMEELAPGPAQPDCLAAVELEHDNLVTAADRAPADALLLAASLAWWWSIRGRWTEGRRVLARALHAAPEDSRPARANAMIAAGHLAEHQQDLDEARHQFETALAMAAEIDDDLIAGLAHNGLADVARERGEFERALSHCDVALALLSPADASAVARALNNRGSVQFRVGHLDMAKESMLAARSIHVDLGSRRAVAVIDRNLGEIARRAGDLPTAQSFAESGLAGAREIGDAEGVCVGLFHVANVAAERGDAGRAAELFHEALVLARAFRFREQVRLTSRNLGVLAMRRGATVEARGYFQESLEATAPSSSPQARLTVLPLLAQCLLKVASPAHARPVLNEIIALAPGGDERGEWAQTTLAELGDDAG